MGITVCNQLIYSLEDKLESFYARLTAIFVKIAEDEGRREGMLVLFLNVYFFRTSVPVRIDHM